MSEERQLDLLKTKRQKGKLPPGPSEFQIHCALSDTLARWISPGWVAFHPPNEGLRARKTNPKTGKTYSPEAQRLARMGVHPGVSDLILFGPPIAMIHALEIKRPGEEPTEDQSNFLKKVIAAGGQGRWCDSVEVGLRILKEWGALRVTITL
jgi:hypothetical protein